MPGKKALFRHWCITIMILKISEAQFDKNKHFFYHGAKIFIWKGLKRSERNQKYILRRMHSVNREVTTGCLFRVFAGLANSTSDLTKDSIKVSLHSANYWRKDKHVSVQQCAKYMPVLGTFSANFSVTPVQLQWSSDPAVRCHFSNFHYYVTTLM